MCSFSFILCSVLADLLANGMAFCGGEFVPFVLDVVEIRVFSKGLDGFGSEVLDDALFIFWTGRTFSRHPLRHYRLTGSKQPCKFRYGFPLPCLNLPFKIFPVQELGDLIAHKDDCIHSINSRKGA